MAASTISFRLCGGILVAMPTAMPVEPLTRRLGMRVGRTTGSLLAFIEVRNEIDRFLFDVREHFLGDFREARLGIPHGCGRVAIDRAKISLAVDKRIAHVEILREADKGVVDRRIAVRMILAKHFADDLGALAIGRVEVSPNSYMPKRMRRWTGFKPSRTSGRARPMITLMA